MNATPLRLLIVDDHADNARMLKVLLRKEGHEAAVVFDGPAAIAAANHHKPDVVLLDLSLPGMSGIEVAAELRRNPEQSRMCPRRHHRPRQGQPAVTIAVRPLLRQAPGYRLPARLSFGGSGQAETAILDAGRRLRPVS